MQIFSMDYRYYYDNLEYTGVERRNAPRRRAREIVAAGAVATAVAVAGHALGVLDGQAITIPNALAALMSLALHRPVLRLLRGDGPLLRMIGAR